MDDKPSSYALIMVILIVGIIVPSAIIVIQGNYLISKKINESIETCNTCFTTYNVNEQCNITWKPCGKSNGSTCIETPDSCIDFGEKHCPNSCPFLFTLKDSFVKNVIL